MYLLMKILGVVTFTFVHNGILSQKFSGWKYADAYRLPKMKMLPRDIVRVNWSLQLFECGIGEKPTLWYQTKTPNPIEIKV